MKLEDLDETPWPTGRLLASRFVSWDAGSRTVAMAFIAPPEFANMRGSVQGGLVGGFLDEAMGAALYLGTNGKLQITLDMTISFVRPVPLGPLTATARVVKAGAKVVFLEGELFGDDGKLCARATATSLPAEWPTQPDEAER